MASQVGICNLALAKLGAASIRDLNDGTRNANQMQTIYDACLDAELSAHPWTFASTRALIPADVTAPVFGWQYRYPLPTGYLKMIEIGQHWLFYTLSSCGPWFQIEGGAILTDEGSPLQIRHIQRITNAGLLPPLFVQSLACRLAFESAEALTQNLSKRQQAQAEWKDAIRQAKRTNDIELPPQSSAATSWELAMRGFEG